MAEISEESKKQRNRVVGNGLYLNTLALDYKDYTGKEEDETVRKYLYYYKLRFFERRLPIIKDYLDVLLRKLQT